MAAAVKKGVYTGDGAAQNIELGFVPNFIMLVNVTDGDLVAIWSDDMADGTAVDIAAAAATNAADGITAYEPTDYSSKPGFSVGTDYSESGKSYAYAAFRDGGY